MSAIEDEFHFLCICPSYNVARASLFNSATDIYPPFAQLSNKNKFVFIITHLWKELGKVLNISWQIRQSKLYQTR